MEQLIELEQGWGRILQTVITKLKETLEGNTKPIYSEEYMEAYTTIYNMCTQKPPDGYSLQLYDRYRETFEHYLSSTVVPCLREKRAKFMLEELVQRWSNHKTMVRLLSRCFNYLDRYSLPRRDLPTLTEVGLTCFRDMVFGELNGEVVDAVITLIDREREGEGEKIDRGLFKNVADVVSLVNEEREGEKIHGALLKEVADAFVEVGALIDEERESREKNTKLKRTG